MLDSIRLLGTPRAGAPYLLYTRENTLVEAFRGVEPSDQCPQRFAAFLDRHPRAMVRKGITGGYNCAGLVWSSRRAVVPHPPDWQLLLEEDGYRLIDDSEAAIGDIVVYRDAKSPFDILHIGRLCLMDAMLLGEPSTTHPRIFMVLSKLDGTLGEVVHRKDDIDFFGDAKFTSHVFTDR